MKVTDELVREIEIEIALSPSATFALPVIAQEWLRALLNERQEYGKPFDDRLKLAMENSLSRTEAKAQARREGWEACREAAAKAMCSRCANFGGLFEPAHDTHTGRYGWQHKINEHESVICQASAIRALGVPNAK